MNDDTLNLIERPFLQIVDDLLTSILGGVVNEPILYDLKQDSYPLSQPASDVRSITGTFWPTTEPKPRPFTFQKNVDFVFDSTANAVVWPNGGKTPADDTTFYVDYFIPNSRSPLSDINVGSVTRTLSEAIGREIATVYQLINEAYRSGFIETAKGQSLDLVVAILGIHRKTAEFASGIATFFRDTNSTSDGNIVILEGTRISTEKGVTFETSELRTLQRGQVRIDVPIRAVQVIKNPQDLPQANQVNTLTVPITGIASVTNIDPIQKGSDAETDDQLRARAKAVLRGLGKATLAALYQAVTQQGGTLAEVWDPNGPPAKTADPGKVVLLVQSEPERFPNVKGAVEETRAAGVQATVVANYVFFRPRLVARVGKSITAAGKLKIVADIISALQKYVDSLKTGDPAKGEDLLKAVKGVKDVTEPKFLDVMAWRTDVGHPVTETLVDTLLNAVATSGTTDAAALRTALTGVVKTSLQTAPTASRIPDRTLVQTVAPERQGQRATDTDIESAQFQVVTPDKTWWVVLDMDVADILLTGQS